ncbi:transcription factor/nuclear export subunit protein 2-domain-containing protein [Dioszegia hungarica]|uniref:THO complex subunit 2 n=1 Tax=Dioszegia hungarica TaxID=4972 RepID=A0AA38HCZ1_9TREE|nr:transcription factor/nuclear export subunit protein 2-domain-containing protein [Dioszegia hungarica]KAI9637923.1 transcription factor/nuclear export subunit protein 2-domain-containing protein [Dioszegia hungarica]
MPPRQRARKSEPEKRPKSESLTPVPNTPPAVTASLAPTLPSIPSGSRSPSAPLTPPPPTSIARPQDDRLGSGIQKLRSISGQADTFRIAETWISILSSELGVEGVLALYRARLEEIGEDEAERSRLGEGFVEVVEVLEEEREDKAEARGGGKGKGKGKEGTNGAGLDGDAIDVDGEERAMEPGPKGMAVLKKLLESSSISPLIPTLIISTDRLVALDLHPFPHDPAILQRSLVKRNTALFFRQQKYNLLRESSEGFSGLVVLLTSADAMYTPPRNTAEAAPDRKARAQRVWSKIMGLIGYFNLSPPRVLDLILEVASCHVAAHWRFWLDLLRCSPWGTHADTGDVKGKGKERAVDWQIDEMAAIEGCMAGEGDRVLAQVLGVKFGFCQRPDVGANETQIGLVYFAALLLKHGFVSLTDLLPFLSPDDAEMASIQQKHASSSSSRSGPLNALASSVLLDDDAPAVDSSTGQSAETATRPPPEQRIQLVQALLAVGHMPAALYFLGRFPWLAQYSPTIADLVMRIVEVGIEGLYARFSDTWRDSGDLDLDFEAPAPTYKAPNREVVPSILVPLPPDTPSTSFTFFCPDWAEGVERWTSIEEIRTKGMRWLSLVRGLGGRRVETVVKICRIGAVYFEGLQKDKAAALGLRGTERTRAQNKELLPTEAELQPWLELLRISILPCLSASTFTAAFDIEIWRLLRFFPYAVRYGLYGEWRDSTCRANGRNPCPIAVQCAAESTRDVKKALSRVTAAQSGPASGAAGIPDRGPARALAKLSHSNPCALWATAVTQVKSYSNIGQFIVEAGRYMSQLSMDVAMFTLVDTLSDDTASRLNPQGTGVAAWLENLATFVGDFNRRYWQMDLEPVLQFIVNRLMRGQSADLTILQSLISIMSGESKIDNDAISNDQLRAYGSGREMIREAFNSTVIAIPRPMTPGDPAAQGAQAAPVDKAKPTKKSLARLISGLRDTGLDMPIWIALAQTRQGAVDKMVGAPIKAMSSMQDNCHDIFIQYGDLLSEQLLSSEHIERTPDLQSLVSEYGLDFAQAFQILRPKLDAQMEKARSAEKASMNAKLDAAKLAIGGARASLSPGQPTTPLGSPRIEGMQIDAEDGEGSEFGSEPATPSSAVMPSIPLPQKGARKRWWPSALTSTMHQANTLLPIEVKGIMSAPFFVIFWQLSMPDISFASDAYDRAIHKITSLEKEVGGWRSGTTAVAASHREERARLKARLEALTEERDAHNNLVNTINKRRFKLESARWFGSSITQKNLKTRLSVQLHQHCFYPRAILTPSDAVFVPKLIRMMHDLATPGFVTLFAYSNFFSPGLAACIFSCTENEARNFGRCLGAIMSDLDAWHADEDRYRREAIGRPDGAADDDSKCLPGMLVKGKNQEHERPMTWSTFRNFYAARFHTPMLEALTSCWAETDFMHVKNAITVALQVLKSFPIITAHGEAVEAAMEALIQRGKDGELTPDVLHQCQAYLRQLKLRQNTKPYVPPPKFYPSAAEAPVTVTTPTGTPKDLPPVSAPTPATALSSDRDPEALKAKLREQKALKNAATSGIPAKPPPPERLRSISGSTADALPANVSPTGGLGIRGSAADSKPASKAESTTPAKPAPTGPAKPSNGLSSLPPRPGSILPTAAPAAASSMGPPRPLTSDEERAANRAKKFGTTSRGGTPGPASTPPTTESSRPASPAVSSSRRRSPSPAPSRHRHRSRSVESRMSDRSRRDRGDGRDRDDRDGRDSRHRDRSDRERSDRDRDRDRERESGRDSDDEERDKKKQEEILQSRHDRLSATSDRDRDRRGGRESDRDRERDEKSSRDRDGGRDRDTKEAERDRDRKESAEVAGSKRKREEEPPRRIDPVVSGRRERSDTLDKDKDKDGKDARRKDDHRDRGHDRRDDRRGGSGGDERRAESDKREEDRQRRRGSEREKGRDDRGTRSPPPREMQRDLPPHASMRDLPPRPRDSSTNGGRAVTPDRPTKRYSPSRSLDPIPDPTGGRTPKKATADSPKRNGKVELIPTGPSSGSVMESARIVEAPKSTRPEVCLILILCI